MNISFMNLPIASEYITGDYAWMSFKTYQEQNYKGSIDWNWNYPIIDSNVDDIDELVNQIVFQKPNVFGISLYVWNIGLSLKVAEKVKTILPDCLIVVGGPHIVYKENQNYFKEKWFIDFVCESDGYGEVFFNEFLYQIETDKNWELVPYLVYPSSGRNFHKTSTVEFNKKDFRWPKNIYGNNKDYILSRKEIANRENKKFFMSYETSRGCPFGCTYCEWGGGINSKVSFKPTEYIFEDYEFIFKELKPHFFNFIDANLGISSRDVSLVEKLCEYKVQTGYPESVYYFGPSKVKKENVYKIDRLIAKHGMTVDYKISAQDLEPVVNKNIDRTDDAWESQLEEYKKIRSEYGGKLRFELIMGLPGATLESFYRALDYSCPDGIYAKSYIWHLLPTTPAATREYREKFQIKTVKLKYGLVDDFSLPRIIDENLYEKDFQHKNLLLNPDYIEPTNIVIGTYSYTQDDWIEMYMMSGFVEVFEVQGYLKYITKYLSPEIKHSEFYSRMWKTFLNSNKYLKKQQIDIIELIKKQLNDKLNSNETIYNLDYFNLPDYYPWKIKSKVEPLLNILINLNRKDFFNCLKLWIQDEYELSDELKDLIEWNSNMVLWLDYNPQEYSFHSKYDWVTWSKTGQIIRKNTVNIPQDTTYSSENIDIDWHKYLIKERIQRYFLTLCSNVNHFKLFNIVETNYV